MQKKSLVLVIGVVLLLFVLSKLLISQFCEPDSKNAVVNSAVNAVANAISSPDSGHQTAKPDPLSWDPILHSLANLLSKACPK